MAIDKIEHTNTFSPVKMIYFYVQLLVSSMEDGDSVTSFILVMKLQLYRSVTNAMARRWGGAR